MWQARRATPPQSDVKLLTCDTFAQHSLADHAGGAKDRNFHRVTFPFNCQRGAGRALILLIPRTPNKRCCPGRCVLAYSGLLAREGSLDVATFKSTCTRCVAGLFGG
jgi:hypothetical protein